MDEDRRFDTLVGLIYDSAHAGLDPGQIAEAIALELDALGVRLSDEEDSQRQMLEGFVSQLAGLGYPGDLAPIDDDPTDSALQALEQLEQGSSAERLLRRLGHHLTRSAGLRQRLAQNAAEQALRDSGMALVPFGMVWVGADHGVVYTNARADTMLRAGDGLWMLERRLHAATGADTERLERALAAALDPVERQSRLMAIRRFGQTLPLLLSVMPATAPSLDAPTGPVALVILQNPGEAAMDLEHLQAIYGFTAAERRLAEALLDNQTLESYAEATGVSRHTARSHLARLFAKTGTARQAELVRLLMLAQPRT